MIRPPPLTTDVVLVYARRSAQNSALSHYRVVYDDVRDELIDLRQRLGVRVVTQIV